MNIRPALAFLCLLPSLSLATDLENGKTLHGKHCTSCHEGMVSGDGSELYTRKNRRVKDLLGLENQVRRCESNLELKWFDEDIDDVTQHLNKTYYKFEDNK